MNNFLFSKFEQAKKIEKYFLPLAAFFILFSTAAINFFILAAVFFTTISIIANKQYKNLLEKKFMLYGILIFTFLAMSSYYSIADFDSIYVTLKKYIKFLYIPILFIHIKKNKNHLLIIKYFLAGASIVLLLSYLKYFNIIDLNYLYKYYDMNLVGTITKASVFQTSIVHGAIFSFVFYLSIYIAKKNNNYVLYIFSLLCLCNIFFMNDSRNSYIVAFLLIILVIYYYFNKKRYAVTTLSLLLFFSLSILPVSNTFTHTIKDSLNDISILYNDNDFTSSIGLRSLWFINGINNIGDKPLFGSGVGSYNSTIKDFIFKNNINVKKDLAISNNPHNEFISLSTQLGLFGFTLYVLFLITLFKQSINNFLGSGVFVILLVSSFFNSVLYDNVFGLFIILIISLVYQDEFYE